MEICEDGHDAIVYDGRECPVCDMAGMMSDAKDKVEGFISGQEDIVKELMGKFEEAEKTGMAVSDLYLKRKVEEFATDELESIKWD